jgi:hypothetical protein
VPTLKDALSALLLLLECRDKFLIIFPIKDSTFREKNAVTLINARSPRLLQLDENVRGEFVMKAVRSRI